MALSAYRTLLRSTRIAFQSNSRLNLTLTTTNLIADDIPTLLAARHNARSTFEKHRDLPASGEEATKQIHYANDVARILRENVLQGEQVDGKDGTYST